MEDAYCSLFGGVSGKLVVLTLTGSAFCAYVAAFAYRRRRQLDSRSFKVFWLDLLKMGTGQTAALAVNVLNAHRNSSTEFDAVSWYLPTFLNDELIAVPLGVLLWHKVVLRLASALRARCFPRSMCLRALEASGKYYPSQGAESISTSGNQQGGAAGVGAAAVGASEVGHAAISAGDREPRLDAGSVGGDCFGGADGSDGGEGGEGAGDARKALMAAHEPAACGILGEVARRIGRACESSCCCASYCAPCCCPGGEPRLVRYDWWLVQLVAWVACVLCSRLLGGLVVPAAAAAFGEASPYYLLAQSIHSLSWSCDAKRWTFAGVLRIAIDVLQLAVVDWFNKYHARRPSRPLSANDGMLSMTT